MLNELIKNLDGTPLLENDKELKVSDVVLFSLLNAPLPEKQAESEKLIRYKLSQKVHNANDETKFDLDELHLMKNLSMQMMSTLVAGQIAELFEANK